MAAGRLKADQRRQDHSRPAARHAAGGAQTMPNETSRPRTALKSRHDIRDIFRLFPAVFAGYGYVTTQDCTSRSESFDLRRSRRGAPGNQRHRDRGLGVVSRRCQPKPRGGAMSLAFTAAIFLPHARVVGRHTDGAARRPRRRGCRLRAACCQRGSRRAHAPWMAPALFSEAGPCAHGFHTPLRDFATPLSPCLFLPQLLLSPFTFNW